MAKEHSPYGSRVWDSILCAMATAVYFAVVLPLQSYLATAENFTFGLGEILYGCCLRVFCLISVAGIVLLVTNRWCRGRMHLALIGLIMAAVVESGPGAIGLPELNGEFDGYRNVVRGTVDIVALTVVFVTPLLMRRWLNAYVGLISICLMLFTAASLLDVKRMKSHDDAPSNNCIKGIAPRIEVLHSASFSPDNNVVLLILDAMASFAVQDILRADAQLAAEFEGFVNYTQNVGMHNPTQAAVPGLLTGKYLKSAQDIATYGISFFSHDSAIAPYVSNNIPVYLNVDLGVNGYTNRRIGKDEPVKSTGMGVFNEQMPGTFALAIDDICAFRILPYFFKESFLMFKKRGETISHQTRNRKRSQKINLSRDDQVWPFLARSPVDAGLLQTFHVHHTNGGHIPIVHDENGNSIKCTNPLYADYCGQCKFALRKVAEMFAEWKTNGVYEASTIVIAGDHGPWFKKPGMDYSRIPPPAFPVLMIKPRASREAYVESSLPTTHANISKVLKSLASQALNRFEMEQILVTDEPRLFRLANSGKLKDWYVLKDGSVKFEELEDGEPSLESIKPLEYELDYDFRAGGNTIYPEFRVENGNRIDTGGLAIVGDQMTIFVRISEPCVIAFSGMTRASDKSAGFVDLEVCTKHGKFNAEFSKYIYTTCKIELVKPNEDGIVKINFKKIGRGLHFVLKKMKLYKMAPNAGKR